MRARDVSLTARRCTMGSPVPVDQLRDGGRCLGPAPNGLRRRGTVMGMTADLAYEMSSAAIARAGAHQLRELGAAGVKVTVPLRSATGGYTLAASVPTPTRRRPTDSSAASTRAPCTWLRLTLTSGVARSRASSASSCGLRRRPSGPCPTSRQHRAGRRLAPVVPAAVVEHLDAPLVVVVEDGAAAPAFAVCPGRGASLDPRGPFSGALRLRPSVAPAKVDTTAHGQCEELPMPARQTPRLLSVTPVKPGREQEFENFIRDVIVPAARENRPHLMGQWQTLRPESDLHGDGTRAYAFLFYGDAPVEDWDVDTLLTTAFGEDEGERRLRQWTELIDGDQTIVYVAGEIASS